MEQEKLDEVLRKHLAWLRGEDAGRRANLYGANLDGANLHGADLHCADLHGADLHCANLYGANLYGADLRDANLYGADLHGADLHCANLYGANLCGADLRDANLYGADLRDANLDGANLHGADLHCADLHGAKNAEYSFALTNILSDGDLIGWKKLRGDLICKLHIPASARRSNATGRKCRADCAEVLEIWDCDKPVNEGTSKYDIKFVYRVGETVKVDNFDVDRWNECSTGIHFFITRCEAERY